MRRTDGKELKRIYVVIGGPGFGKTSLVKALHEKGFYCMYDSATDYIAELLEEDKNVDRNSPEFNRKIIIYRKNQYHSAPDKEICFFDRGIPDSLAYVNNAPEEFWETARRHGYMKTVFVAPPWKEIYENIPSRTESFEEACKIHKRIVEVYETLGYKVVDLPKASVAERVKFILKHIKK